MEGEALPRFKLSLLLSFLYLIQAHNVVQLLGDSYDWLLYGDDDTLVSKWTGILPGACVRCQTYLVGPIRICFIHASCLFAVVCGECTGFDQRSGSCNAIHSHRYGDQSQFKPALQCSYTHFLQARRSAVTQHAWWICNWWQIDEPSVKISNSDMLQSYQPLMHTDCWSVSCKFWPTRSGSNQEPKPVQLSISSRLADSQSIASQKFWQRSKPGHVKETSALQITCGGHQQMGP